MSSLDLELLTYVKSCFDSTIHHHIGAVDLLPFHPIGSCTLDEAAVVANEVHLMK